MAAALTVPRAAIHGTSPLLRIVALAVDQPVCPSARADVTGCSDRRTPHADLVRAQPATRPTAAPAHVATANPVAEGARIPAATAPATRTTPSRS